MLRSTVMLRLLLSLALILNGIGGAVASTGMQMEDAGWRHGALHADAAEQAAQPPCQEHTGMTVEEEAAGIAAMGDTSAKTTHSPDCCESGTCRCMCVHQSQVAIAVTLFPEFVIGHSTSVRSMKPAHATPALPHLIRPPIG